MSKKMHITNFADFCGVSKTSVYNNVEKFELTLKKEHGATFVIIDRNALLFKKMITRKIKGSRNEKA